MNFKDILWRWQSGYKTTNVQCRHSWIKKKLKLGQHELLQIVQFKYVSRSLKLVNCCLQLISRLSLCKLEILNQYSTSSLLWEHFSNIVWQILYELLTLILAECNYVYRPRMFTQRHHLIVLSIRYSFALVGY
jgi:hypothetical protein